MAVTIHTIQAYIIRERVSLTYHSIFVPRVYRGTWRYVPRLPKSLETDTAVAVPRLLDPEIPRYRRESHQIVD